MDITNIIKEDFSWKDAQGDDEDVYKIVKTYTETETFTKSQLLRMKADLQAQIDDINKLINRVDLEVSKE